MKKDINNDIYSKDTVQRWMRVINDDTGEYYDIPFSTGTTNEQRNIIADNIKLLASNITYIDGSIDVFPWTRVILYCRKKDKFATNNGEIGTCYYKQQPEGEFEFFKIDENMEIIEDSKISQETYP